MPVALIGDTDMARGKGLCRKTLSLACWYPEGFVLMGVSAEVTDGSVRVSVDGMAQWKE